ncbi:uncharacterized protein SCHCODRAFT_02547343 [Schizophyllum commune H4-8]|uniref:Zinc-finger domain-containing protein n=1 Tax=Schizophyllum commune (strain H4-8 / FGSC 9210) TaxID=578458 RepID=D8Q976_SCHCM|nr:uncharacterized protein SCHCODRAFT_02547343 [Schizophyllum commune H4-8]KAI5890523.1 hypothetical protein SCHCODRAFT_02547343 [Schizophyllum commune H4-8]
MSARSPAIQRISHIEVPSSPFALSSYSRIGEQPEASTTKGKGVQRSSHAGIPPSPIAATKQKPPKSRIDVMDTANDATTQSRVDNTSNAALKRKLSASNVAVDMTALKKTKAADGTAKPAKTSKPTENAQPGAETQLFYCHQCRKKRSVEGSRRCTRLLPPQGKKGIEKQCSASYCAQCLTTRYKTDVLNPLPSGSCADHKHLKSADYTWCCPKCRDICACSTCRHAKGLDPLGPSKQPKSEPAKADSKSGADKVPAKTKPKPKPTAKPQAADQDVKGKKVAPATTERATKKTAAASRPKATAPKTKPECTVPWRPVSGDIDFDEAVIRMNIREFALRFHQAMKPALPKVVVEEFEMLVTPSFTDAPDALVPWISEPCAKAIVIGLLSMIVETREGDAKLGFQRAIKDLKQTGVTLSKVWGILEGLREYFRGPDSGIYMHSEEEDPKRYTKVRLPDPLPLPEGTVRKTRQMKDQSGIVVAQTAQLVPVIAALAEAAGFCPAVRDVLDSSAQEIRDAIKDMRDALKVENDRWDTERKAMDGKDKAEEARKRTAHKQNVQDIEDALKVITLSHNIRCNTLLGEDIDGREYYVLAPSLAQRDLALAFLAHKASPGMVKAKRRRGRDLNEARALKKWSTFVAVYGKRPESAPTDEDDEEDGKTRGWFGFADPADIEKLAEWVKACAEAKPEDEEAAKKMDARASSESANDRCGPLVKGLLDFAASTRWQVKADEVPGRNGVPLKPIPCANFYS